MYTFTNCIGFFPELYLTFTLAALLLFSISTWPPSLLKSNELLETKIILRNIFSTKQNWRNIKKKYALNFQKEIAKTYINNFCIFNTALKLSIFALLIELHLLLNQQHTLLGKFIYNDPLVSTIKIFLTIIVLILLINLCNNFLKPLVFELILLILFCLLGLNLLISTTNLLIFYLTLELQSFALYILTALKRTNEHSVEASLKYFILGAFSSGFILYGTTFLYGFTGTIDLNQLHLILQAPTATDLIQTINIGLIFIFIGLFFKLGLVPFHVWLPDVYEGAPTQVTALMATLPKLALMTFLLKVLSLTYILNESHTIVYHQIIQPIITSIAVSSIFLGTIAALYQFKIKRLIAYSTISHGGYILLATTTTTTENIQAILLYFFLYIFASLGLFIALFNTKTNTSKKANVLKEKSIYTKRAAQTQPIFITDWALMIKNNKTLNITLLVFILSIAGIPPFAGFFAKLYLLLSILSTNFYFLAVSALITSVIGAFFYIRLLKILYFYVNKNVLKQKNLQVLTYWTSISLSILALALLLLMLQPIQILYLTHKLALLLIL